MYTSEGLEMNVPPCKSKVWFTGAEWSESQATE